MVLFVNYKLLKSILMMKIKLWHSSGLFHLPTSILKLFWYMGRKSCVLKKLLVKLFLKKKDWRMRIILHQTQYKCPNRATLEKDHGSNASNVSIAMEDDNLFWKLRIISSWHFRCHGKGRTVASGLTHVYWYKVCWKIMSMVGELYANMEVAPWVFNLFLTCGNSWSDLASSEVYSSFGGVW